MSVVCSRRKSAGAPRASTVSTAESSAAVIGCWTKCRVELRRRTTALSEASDRAGAGSNRGPEAGEGAFLESCRANSLHRLRGLELGGGVVAEGLGVVDRLAREGRGG